MQALAVAGSAPSACATWLGLDGYRTKRASFPARVPRYQRIPHYVVGATLGAVACGQGQDGKAKKRDGKAKDRTVRGCVGMMPV